MILKVGRAEYGVDWWIKEGIDEIEVLSIVTSTVKKLAEVALGYFDAFVLDNYFNNNDWQPDDEAKYRIFTCTLKSGGTYSIIYDTIAYLCNDEGKTIDTFRV